MPDDSDLYQIAVSVRNLDSSVAFYRDILGIRLIHQFVDGPKLAFFDLGGPRLMMEQSEHPSGSLFYLYVNDMDATIVRLRAQDVEIHQDPVGIFEDVHGLFGPPEQTEYLAFIKDPDGLLIGLMSRK